MAAAREQGAARPTSNVVRQVVEADDVPDLFADEFWLTWNQKVGATLTLLANVPGDPNGKSAVKTRIVGRVRMPLLVMAQLGKLITDQVQVVPAPESSGDGPKN